MAAFSGNFGEVLYRVGEENSEDVWDDTALIEAYDRAVNIVKNGKWNSSNKGKGTGKARKQQNSKRKEKQKHHQTDLVDQWQVGDSCCAVYSDDRETYEATIVSIDRENKTCIVQYDEYGNEEEQQLKDLMQSNKIENLPDKGYYTVDSPYYTKESPRQTPMDCDVQFPSFTDIYWKVSDICLAPEQPSGHWHEAVINSFPTQHSCQVTFIRSRRSQQVDRSQLCHSRDQGHNHHGYYHHSFRPPGPWPPPPPPPPQMNFPFQNPYFPPIPPPSEMMPMFGQARKNLHPPMPPIPPAPPHPPTAPNSEDNEALASMLMSWYLSGYYTGYYQGTQRRPSLQNDVSGQTTQPDTTNTSISGSQPSTSVKQD